MPSTIVLNESNVVTTDGLNNKLAYSFPNSVAFPNHEIAIQSLSMYYSWQNVNSGALNNNVFYYYWPVPGQIDKVNGATATAVPNSSFPNMTTAQYSEYKVVIPSGLYEIADLNSYLQYTFIQNGHYASTTSSTNIYFGEFVVNSSAYGIQLNTYPVLTQAGLTVKGYTVGIPANLAYSNASITNNYGLPATVVGNYSYNWCISMFQMSMSTDSNRLGASNFGNLIGYANSFYSSYTPQNQANNTSYLSSTSPEIQPNPILYIAISNIENKYSNPNTIIGTITPGVQFGDLITITPPQFAWNKLLSGTYQGLRLSLLGSNYAPIQILDPNMTFVLVIRNKDETDILSAIQGGK